MCALVRNDSLLSCNDVHGHVEDLGHLQDGVDPAAGGGGHVMGGAGLAPAVAEVPGAAGKAGAHVGVAEGEDGAWLVDALGQQFVSDVCVTPDHVLFPVLHPSPYK